MKKAPKILKADVLGFCMGVKRAMTITLGLAEKNPDIPIRTLGPLIHNPVALEHLESKGISVFKPGSEEKKGFLVIRAHGIPPAEEAGFRDAGYKVVDATCPRVQRSQRTARKYSQEGYHVVIVGDKNHGEVRGISGYTESFCVISTKEEARSIKVPPKTLVLGQTTFGKEDYAEICGILKEKNPDCVVFQSICPATERRQEALKKLLENVEAVLVVGGKNSANTARLYQTAEESGKKVWYVESANEIPPDILDYGRIGITAGASTPDWVIRDIDKKIKGGDF